MRYTVGEVPIIAQSFLPNDDVTIEVLDLTTDTLLTLTDDECVESSVMSGVYTWSTSNFQSAPSSLSHLFFRMTNSAGLQREGKIILNGYPSLMDNHQRGTIRINTTTDPWREEHLDVTDGVTVVDSFGLYDGDGNAINDANPLTQFIGERRRV